MVFAITLIFKKEALNLIFSYQIWINKNFYLTLLVFYSTFILAGILILPAALFEIINGFIFGTFFDGNFLGYFLGLGIYLIISAISGTLCYMISKFILGKKIKEILIDPSNKMQILNYMFKNQGLWCIFLIRLSPLTPTNIFNYLAGGFESKIFI